MNPESLISSVVVAVIGLAIVAVLVSNRANTANVIGASGKGLAGVIQAAVSPVTGGGGVTLGALPQTLTSSASFGAANN